MTTVDRVAFALVVVGLALLLAPALFPLQPVLVHDTRGGGIGNASTIEFDVVAYENLSDRGQELYVTTLRSGGRYTVALGDGAPEFTYPTPEELAAANTFSARRALTVIVIKRPATGDLPPADEPVRQASWIAERPETEAGPAPNLTVAEIRQRIARFDLMTTKTGLPPLLSTPSLLRLLPILAGVVSLGVGGYLRSKP